MLLAWFCCAACICASTNNTTVIWALSLRFISGPANLVLLGRNELRALLRLSRSVCGRLCLCQQTSLQKRPEKQGFITGRCLQGHTVYYTHVVDAPDGRGSVRRCGKRGVSKVEKQ